MADPDSDMCAGGEWKQLFDAIPGHVRMALSYYAPLADIPDVDFRLQSETLYNSTFAYDDEMLINQHVYGDVRVHGPSPHLHRMDGGDFFNMYLRSGAGLVEDLEVGRGRRPSHRSRCLSSDPRHHCPTHQRRQQHHMAT